MPLWRKWRSRGIRAAYFGAQLDDLAIPEEALLELEAYSRRPDGTLMLLGPVGTGKTHAAAAILQAQRDGYYFTQSRLIADHRKRYRTPEAPDVREQAIEAPLLVLDELCRSVGGNDAESLLFDVIDSRYSDGRPTIICSNCTRESMVSEMGSAIVDRIRGDLFNTVDFMGASSRGGEADRRRERLALVERLEKLEGRL